MDMLNVCPVTLHRRNAWQSFPDLSERPEFVRSPLGSRAPLVPFTDGCCGILRSAIRKRLHMHRSAVCRAIQASNALTRLQRAVMEFTGQRFERILTGWAVMATQSAITSQPMSPYKRHFFLL